MQIPLSLPGMWDSSARMAGEPAMPRTRGDCIGGSEARSSGAETCPHVRCRYHLLGELTRRPEREAIEAIAARQSGEWRDSCALDVADRGGCGDAEHAVMLGITRERLIQLSAEASSRMRAAIERQK